MTFSIDLKPVLGFMGALERNNNKAWFDAHRERYEQAHAAFEAYVEELIGALAAGDGLAGVSPKECVFRLNRDLRFSRDKSPYKTYMSAAIGPGERSRGRSRTTYRSDRTIGRWSPVVSTCLRPINFASGGRRSTAMLRG